MVLPQPQLGACDRGSFTRRPPRLPKCCLSAGGTSPSSSSTLGRIRPYGLSPPRRSAGTSNCAILVRSFRGTSGTGVVHSGPYGATPVHRCSPELWDRTDSARPAGFAARTGGPGTAGDRGRAVRPDCRGRGRRHAHRRRSLSGGPGHRPTHPAPSPACPPPTPVCPRGGAVPARIAASPPPGSGTSAGGRRTRSPPPVPGAPAR